MDMTESCQRDNNFFKGVIDLIPPLFYFDSESKLKLKVIAQNDKLFSGEAGRNPRKSEWKFMKYDPKHVKTVTEIQKELLARENNVAEKKIAKKASKLIPEEDDCSLKSATDSLEELREKLHTKLQILKDKRKSMKRADWLEKKRLKRKVSKMKNKIKKSVPSEARDQAGRHEKQQRKECLATGSNEQKPIYNSEGKIVFSKFDFTESKSDERVDKDVLLGKNYKKLLEKVQGRKQKLTELKVIDEEKAQQLETKSQWSAVLHKAQGLKVKDNEELLKKALKKKEKFKQKTKKQWDARQDKVDKKMKETQDKRKSNIKKKKQARIDKKVKKAKKKGRIVPGF